MHVEDLLRLEPLDLTLLWGSPPLLAREISGVTATDLEDPGRFLQRGEIVLSGLVWWSAADEGAKADRFVAALRDAGAAALLAGEETHGRVPEVLVDACRRHGIALLSVPVHTSFRAITDTVYLRQWGDLSRRPADHYALPENVRGELSRLLADGADPDTLLTRAVAHLGAPPCYVLSATGRTVARTPAAPPLPARQAARRLKAAAPFAAAPASTTLRVDPDASPYGQWYLHLPGPVDAPPRMLHEIAEVFAQYRQGLLRRRAAARVPAAELLDLAAAPRPGPALLPAALRACGLPDHGPYTVIAVSMGAEEGAAEAGAEALDELLRHLPGRRFATARLATGGAAAVIATDSGAPGAETPVPGAPCAGAPGAGAPAAGAPGAVVATLKGLWPTLDACDDATLPYGGISTPAAGPQELNGALEQARYALTAAVRAGSADGTAQLTAVEDLTTLDALLAGIPADVRTAFGVHALGPLADGTNPSHRMLLETLDTFLAHNGSWARTAEALHLHVNTVHYRIGRVELLTGRDLARLDHKLDLKAALLCR
ncbi:helix-turn-helix domain-containing protein [Streptomyces sp. BE282]|uniref:helix-turn-helix domain-containing protein n=1 Tax=Streptomyces sp. BE282 TaxID=3002527 RepID=UPI002E7A7D9D|nr:helix-turn-helix domain-containing protein [Streptomyces sp. BE282]MEE1731651.1 helix-turn-helix domain-containing protein [Streptomyces sp. BE282]